MNKRKLLILCTIIIILFIIYINNKNYKKIENSNNEVLNEIQNKEEYIINFDEVSERYTIIDKKNNSNLGSFSTREEAEEMINYYNESGYHFANQNEVSEDVDE